MKRILLSTLLVAVNFIALYFMAGHVNLLWFLVLLYVVPVLVNLSSLSKVKKEVSFSKASQYIVLQTIMVCLIYIVFAYSFENSSAFAQFISSNTKNISDVAEIEVSSNFLSVGQVLFLGLVNISIQYLSLIRIKRTKGKLATS